MKLIDKFENKKSRNKGQLPSNSQQNSKKKDINIPERNQIFKT